VPPPGALVNSLLGGQQKPSAKKTYCLADRDLPLKMIFKLPKVLDLRMLQMRANQSAFKPAMIQFNPRWSGLWKVVSWTHLAHNR
jgi:hypothetical protein